MTTTTEQEDRIGKVPDGCETFSCYRLEGPPGKTGKARRLDATDSAGRRLFVWRMVDAAGDFESFVRERWGAGNYRIQWYRDGRPGGWSRPFGFAMPIEPSEAAEAPSEVISGGDDDGYGRYERMRMKARSELAEMFELARTLAGGGVAVAPQSTARDAECEALKEQLAEFRHKESMRLEIERANVKHAAELAERDRRIDKLAERVHQAEVVRDEPRDNGPLLERGEPIMGQIFYAAANHLVRNPDILEKIVGGIMGKMSEIQAKTTAAGAPAPGPSQGQPSVQTNGQPPGQSQVRQRPTVVRADRDTMKGAAEAMGQPVHPIAPDRTEVEAPAVPAVVVEAPRSVAS